MFFFNDTATTEIYTLSLHDALPICELLIDEIPHGGADDAGAVGVDGDAVLGPLLRCGLGETTHGPLGGRVVAQHGERSEEHTSELQSRQYFVCRLLLDKKKKIGTAS